MYERCFSYTSLGGSRGLGEERWYEYGYRPSRWSVIESVLDVQGAFEWVE